MTSPNEMITYAVKGIAWALGSAFSLVASFMQHSLPIIQWVGCFTAIVAAVFSIRASRAAIAKAKERK